MQHNGFDLPAADASLDRRRAELAARIARFATSDGVHDTILPGVFLIRASEPSQRMPSVYEPCLCVVVQGRKHALLSGETLVYDPLHYLVVSVTLPARGHVVEASPDKPYLCLRIGIDPAVIGELLIQMRDETSAAPGASGASGASAARGGADRAMFLARLSAPMLDAVLRLVRLMDTPDDVSVLAPLAMREIYYRALIGELGSRLRAVCETDSQAQRVGRAIELLKARYMKPLRIVQLARAAHMSTSALHHRFKQVTTMSPLQYQKQLRLHEARRLMLTEGLEAASAAHRVGYESPSQFSREYRRLFGAPPRKEIGQLRGAAVGL